MDQDVESRTVPTTGYHTISVATLLPSNANRRHGWLNMICGEGRYLLAHSAIPHPSVCAAKLDAQPGGNQYTPWRQIMEGVRVGRQLYKELILSPGPYGNGTGL